MQTEQAHSRQGSLRLGGARADFVAGLGRKVADLRAALGKVRQKPEDLGRREELRKKLQALSSAAKLMKFDVMDRAILEALGIIDRTPIDAALEPVDLDAIEKVLQNLPALAWDDPARAGASEEPPRVAAPSYGALIVGTPVMAEALLEPAAAGRPTFSCESTPDAQAAFDLAKATEPDLVVLDADLPYAVELVEALMDDPLTETTPIVVVGSFQEQGESARYVAMGVAKTLSKPTKRETLRSACEKALEARRGASTTRVMLGEPTLTELGERLATELREAIIARVDPAARDTKIQLGEGSEIIGALWGAIARVREVVTAKSEGQIRFFGPGPEGALPIAPLTNDVAPGTTERALERRGAHYDVRLAGRRVVVADDDPAVVWFMADLLKSAGCIVHEAFDGEQALEAAYRHSPDLVISDILMPKMDGFSLCRALRRDVALRDVPVILLSWKEDLLQRVRELGAGAAGYVRKETDTRAILARVREALRSRARIEARLNEDGEVRGRLDGVSVRTLLEIVCATRPEARVSVRDASFHYEVEIRWGAPHRATRTAGDGTVVKGTRVLAQMLGVGAGRFTVMNSVVQVEQELDGNLAAQLAKPIARARAATALLTAGDMSQVSRVLFDEESLDDYLRATPERARTVARRMSKGETPRQLVLEGACEPSLLEDVVTDLAARGVVVGVEGDGAADLMGPLVARLMTQSDARAAFAPHSPTPAPESCSADPVPLCSSPVPAVVGSLEDAVLREVNKSPAPAQLALPLADAAKAESPEPAPALAEPTVVDGTLYGSEEGEGEGDLEARDASSHDASDESDESDARDADDASEILVEEASKAIAAPTEDDLDDGPESEGTPFTAVSGEEPLTALPTNKSKTWPMVAFIAATAGAVWAVMHFSGAEPSAAKAVQTQPPPPAVDLLVSKDRDVTYTPVESASPVPEGQGVLDVTAPARSTVVVDGSERGKGAASMPLAPGAHDVRVKSDDGDDGCTVEVRAGRVARVKF
jgi:DNA-binding response OmpR family regulator